MDNNIEIKEFKNMKYDDELILKLSDFFAVFGDSTRVEILALLRNGHKNVSEISNSLNLSISAVSHQLKILKVHDLVRTKRDGKYIYYFLSDDHVVSIFDMAIDHLMEK